MARVRIAIPRAAVIDNRLVGHQTGLRTAEFDHQASHVQRKENGGAGPLLGVRFVGEGV